MARTDTNGDGDRDWVCGRDGKRPEPLSDSELDGVRQAMDIYRSDELVARLLATLDDRMRVPAGALSTILDFLELCEFVDWPDEVDAAYADLCRAAAVTQEVP